jgi:aspartate aminotransferase
MVKAFDDRRKKIVSSLRAIPGFECNMPQGAFYVFPYIDKIYQWDKFKELTKGKESVPKSKIFCDYLLEKYEVAAVPGVAFGDDNALRLSYALGQAAIDKGVERISKMVHDLK